MTFLRFTFLTLLLSLSASAFAALRVDAIIYNGSGVVVEILHVDGKPNKRFNPGESKQIEFPPTPLYLPVNFDSKPYRYPCKHVPLAFRKPKLFKSLIRVVIADDQQLYLVPFETPLSELLTVAKTQPQPEGWPIDAVPVVGGDSAESCLGRIVHGQPDYADGVLVALRLFPRDRSAAQAFARLGFRAGDRYKPADATLMTLDSLQAAMLSAGNEDLLLPFLRNDQATTVRITPKQIAKAFGDCPEYKERTASP